MADQTSTTEIEIKPEPIPKEETMSLSLQQEQPEGGTFTCSVCKWSERYHAHGLQIPFARGIEFLEDCYVMRDPFTPYAQNAFLCLGAPCSLCGSLVCMNCSVFYSKRFCRTCAEAHADHFPVEVRKKVNELALKCKD